MTLQELRKAKYKTIKAFAEACGCSPSKASLILQGSYISADDVIDTVCRLLDIDRDTCLDAMYEAREEAEARWRIKHPPRPPEEVEAERRAYVDRVWPTLTDADKRRIHEDAVRLGLVQKERRSPIEMLVDRACGLD